MSNNSKTLSVPKIWDNEQGLGATVLNRHMFVSHIANNQHKSDSLRQNRVSLSAYLHRRLHKNRSSLLSRRDFSVASFFSSAPFVYPEAGGDNHSNFQPTSTSLIHRMTHKPASNSGMSIQVNNVQKSTPVQVISAPGIDTTTLDYRLKPAETITRIPTDKISMQSLADTSPARVNLSNPAILQKSTPVQVISAPGIDTTTLDYRLKPAETIARIPTDKIPMQSLADTSPARVNLSNPAILQKSTPVQIRSVPGIDTTTLDYRLKPAETITRIPTDKIPMQSLADTSPARVNLSNPAILQKKTSEIADISGFQKSISVEKHQTKNLPEGKNDVNEIIGIRTQEPFNRIHRSNLSSIKNFYRPVSLQRSFISLAQHIIPANKLNPLKKEGKIPISRRFDSNNTKEFFDTKYVPIISSNLTSNTRSIKPDHYESGKEGFSAINGQLARTDDLTFVDKTIQRKAYPSDPAEPSDSRNTKLIDAGNFTSDKRFFESSAFDLTRDSFGENQSLTPISSISPRPITQRKSILSVSVPDISHAPFFEHKTMVFRNEINANSAHRSTLMRNSIPVFHSHSDSGAFSTASIDSGTMANTGPKTTNKPFEFIKPRELDISSATESLIDFHAHHPINNLIRRKTQVVSDIFPKPDRNTSFTSNQRGIARPGYWSAQLSIASYSNYINPLTAVHRQFAPLTIKNPGHSGLALQNSNQQVLPILRQKGINNLSRESNIPVFSPLESYSSDGQFTNLPNINSAAAFINQKSSRLIQKQDQMPSLMRSGDHANSFNLMQRPEHIVHESMPSMKMPSGKTDVIVNSNHFNAAGPLLSRSLLALPKRHISRVYMPFSLDNQHNSPKRITAAYSPLKGDVLGVQRKEDVLTNQFFQLPLSAGSNLYSNFGKYFSPSPVQQTLSGVRKSFQTERSIAGISRLPLVHNFSVQRSEAIKENSQGNEPAYIQRQNELNDRPLASMASSAATLEVNSQATNPNQNSLSQDDLVNKVWRKIMRKMAAEQERMGGCSRWV